MMAQYYELKKQNPGTILFFRLGDFYEMFEEDALTASKVLQIALTSRGKGEDGEKTPMCGVPHHSSLNYINKLITAGYKVSICEQTEIATPGKSLTKREITQIITPGTVLHEDFLIQKENIYCAAWYEKNNRYGLAFCDLSTGEFKVTELDQLEKAQWEIAKNRPGETLISSETELFDLYKTTVKETNLEEATQILLKQFSESHLRKLDLENKNVAVVAAAMLIKYFNETQKRNLSHISHLKFYLPDEKMIIDPMTIKNLEITTQLHHALDDTKTAMGARLLKKFLIEPLKNKNEIQKRQNSIGELINNKVLLETTQKAMSQIYDLERIIGRIHTGMANARDLNALKNSLSAALELSQSYESHQSQLFPLHAKDYFQELVNTIEKTIVPEPPLAITEGDIINPNYNAEMVALTDASRGATEWINRYEIELRNQSNLSKLKIGYTNAFGFYIEVSKAASQNVPDTFIRKQTLVNAERYTTPELKTKEAEILTAGERRRKKEHEIFCELRDQIKSNTEILKTLAAQVAFLDVMAGLSQIALKNRYICPQIVEQNTILKIEGGRHPVVEIREKQFVPNDLSMQENAFILLTGPNMAGKSTYMRQNALIVLMAQIGSFVPASAMQWSLIDRIFTRVGASDDIASGHSTFMVEMTETASILNLATQNSLIILDEVGRGTATFDGVSIAWSVSEYLIKKIKAKVIFATHYQELTKLAELYPEVKNYSLAIKEEVREGKKQIVFLRKVINQPCDKSYGVHVAALAGLPNEVVKRAEEILDKLIQDNDQIQLKLF